VAIALCPGSFDPVTLGHLDIIERSSRHFDEVIVAVIRNPQKTASLFSLEDRQQMLKEATQHLTNIRIEFFKGLLVDFARDHGVDAIVRQGKMLGPHAINSGPAVAAGRRTVE